MIYGTLNQPIKKDGKYRGGSTNTATVHIDGDLITVDAKIDVARIEHEYSNALKSIRSIQEYINSVKDNFDKYSSQIAAQNKKINEQDVILKQQITESQQQKADIKAQADLIAEQTTKLDNISSTVATAVEEQKQILDSHDVKLNILQGVTSAQATDLAAQKNDILQLYSDFSTQAEEIRNISSIVDAISPELDQTIKQLQTVIDEKLLQIKEVLTEDYSTKIENVEAKISKIVNESFTATQEVINDLQIKVASAQNEASNATTKLTTINSKINKNINAIDDLNTDVAALNENITNVQDLAVKCSTEIKDLTTRLDNINNTILPLINTKIDEVNDQVESKLGDLTADLNIKFASTDSKISDLEDKVIELTNDCNIIITNKVEEVNKKIEDHISASLRDFESVNEKIDEHISASENEFNNINEKITNTKNSISAIEGAVFSQKDVIENLTSRVENAVDWATYRSDNSIINSAIAEKAASMYFDAAGEFDPSGQSNSYWYMTSNNDMTDPQIIAGPYNFGIGGGSGGGQAFQCGTVVSADGTNLVVPCTLDNILIVGKYVSSTSNIAYLLNATLLVADGLKFQIGTNSNGKLINQGAGAFSITKQNGQTTFTQTASIKFDSEYVYIAWDNAEWETYLHSGMKYMRYFSLHNGDHKLYWQQCLGARSVWLDRI